LGFWLWIRYAALLTLKILFSREESLCFFPSCPWVSLRVPEPALSGANVWLGFWFSFAAFASFAVNRFLVVTPATLRTLRLTIGFDLQFDLLNPKFHSTLVTIRVRIVPTKCLCLPMCATVGTWLELSLPSLLLLRAQSYLPGL
jgi:hypothetical protein